MLKNQIYIFQGGMQSEFDQILNMFSSYIKFLSKRVKHDNVENELRLELFIICKKIDLSKFNDDSCISGYIKVCLSNYTNKLYHKYFYKNEVINSDLCEFNHNSILNSFEDEYNIYFFDLISSLSEKNKEIIKLKYFHQYTDKEIGNMLNLSRQSVNRNLNKSLKILRNNLIRN